MMESTASPTLDIQIESLLSLEDDSSIVDTLFRLPDEDELSAEGGTFGRAVHDRLQARLAQRMRREIEADAHSAG